MTHAVTRAATMLNTSPRRRFAVPAEGYLVVMLYTIFLVLAIIALLVFIFGRARV